MDRSPSDRNQQRLKDHALERAADALLTQSLQDLGPSDYPFHSLRWEQRSATRDTLISDTYEPGIPQPKRDMAQIMRAIWGIVDLSLDERTILARLAEGYTREQVARILEVRLETINALLQSLRRRLERRGIAVEHCESERAEVEEVFREECQRTDYHDEKHCPSGRELCRRNGKCARRWYLRLTRT